ncbi:histone deacetylase [soil metagenome]
MRLLHVTHPSGFRHDTGPLHPERPARLRAAHIGIAQSGVDTEEVEAVPVDPTDLSIVHDAAYVEAIRRFCEQGGGHLDADTIASVGSWEAARAAVGAGLTAVARLKEGFGGPAIITARPPGHHALVNQAMGFCLFNNVAIAAESLRRQGERVCVIDWDVHHGNGTQSTFYSEPDVMYISLHQFPFYPFEGGVTEVGDGEGKGSTINIPLPAFTAGDVYLEAFDRIALAALRRFDPDWVLVSSGFDAHASDPLAELRLTEYDYAAMTTAVVGVVPADRVVVFLEGGYHLPAIRDSLAVVARALVGLDVEEAPSEHRSPEESRRALERARLMLSP